MLIAANHDKPEKAPDEITLSEGMYARAVDLIFVLAFKGAKRLLEISPDQTQMLKRLAVEFMAAPESERGEIMETIVEIMLPDDRIGGIGKPPEFGADVTKRVQRSREYVGGQIKFFRESGVPP
jgi:hypothetical protein